MNLFNKNKEVNLFNQNQNQKKEVNLFGKKKEENKKEKKSKKIDIAQFGYGDDTLDKARKSANDVKNFKSLSPRPGRLPDR